MRAPCALLCTVFCSYLWSCALGCAGDDKRIHDSAEEAAPGEASADKDDAAGQVSGQAAGQAAGATARGSGSAAAASTGRGGVRVRVLWPDAAAWLRAPAGRSPCGGTRRAPLTIHTLGGVGDAVVHVRALSAGRDSTGPPSRPDSRIGRTAAITISQCQPAPRVVVLAPEHPRIEVCNQDEERRTVYFAPEHPANTELGGGATKTKTAAETLVISLSVVGACVAVSLPPSPGVWRVYTDADPDAVTYALVPAPTYERIALTDDRGTALFKNLPRGDYEVLVWYPPVARSEPEQAQALARQQPIQQRARVQVAGNAVADLSVHLAPNAPDASAEPNAPKEL